VVDHFRDQLRQNPTIVHANPPLKEWHTAESQGRLPGLKFRRTLGVCAVAGGPFQDPGQRLGAVDFHLPISPAVFNEGAAVLGRALDHGAVPQHEKEEVLAAVNAPQPEVTAGSRTTAGRERPAHAGAPLPVPGHPVSPI
jgi:hemoglobin